VAIGPADLVLPALLGGRYRPLGPLGRGAIAEVVRARDEASGEDVALKILYPHLRESAAVAERFKREVEIVRRVSHPHVLAIRDVVEGDGQLFLVMDLHEGGDLADRLARRGRLAPDELARLASQLCGALGAAHRAGVVHRDVKPSNVLCGPGPALDVRLCDFGLARASELSGLTTANAVLGTPEYMAPEVITDGHADPRSDVYSLGVVLYEAATGKLPFHGDSPYQLMRQHVDVEAPRAGALALDLPPAVDAAIARALAKDPLDRFATAEDFERALAGTAAAPATKALAPRAGAPRRACLRCGGWLVDAAAACADCGATMLRLERGRAAVLVTGPGAVADKIDAWRHVALYKLLEELPASALRGKPGARKAPRIPFYVVTNVSPESGAALVARLERLGFEARVERRRYVFGPEMGSKVWRLTWRYLAGIGIIFQTTSLWEHFARDLGHWAFFGLYGAAGVATVAAFVTSAVRAGRPLVSSRARPLLGALAEERLGRALPALGSRQDRRLVARVLERLAQIEALGHGPVAAPIGRHAAEAAEALGTLEARREHDASVPADAGRAMEELRKEEHTRVFLRTHLLRAASRLDDLALVATRAAAADSAAARAEVAREVGAIAAAVEAEQELTALLEGPA
jgi:hypothetical protein